MTTSSTAQETISFRTPAIVRDCVYELRSQYEPDQSATSLDAAQRYLESAPEWLNQIDQHIQSGAFHELAPHLTAFRQACHALGHSTLALLCNQLAELSNVAIVDKLMPEYDSVELLMAIKALPEAAALPIILLSPESFADRTRALQAGPVAYSANGPIRPS